MEKDHIFENIYLSSIIDDKDRYKVVSIFSKLTSSDNFRNIEEDRILQMVKSITSRKKAWKYAKWGYLGVVKWLHSNRNKGCTKEDMDGAAEYGHLEIVKFLHENRTEGCTTDAMDYAARNGHLEIVKWLHENRKEGCTHLAMDWAAWNGHLKMVKWLHENRTEVCTIEALDHAMNRRMVQYGQKFPLEVVEWLELHR